VAQSYDPELVVLGVVGRPHGIHGELWFRPHNTQGSPFAGLRSVMLVRNGVSTTYEIAHLRPTPDGALVKLAGVDSRQAASALTLAEVRVPRAALPPLGPGEYYVSDVIGCAVVHENGTPLGTVTGTFWNGAHDVMIVGDTSAAEQLIPLVPNVVVSVDVPGRKVVVTWDGHD
jgi:16S rRNA processing protein RimM